MRLHLVVAALLVGCSSETVQRAPEEDSGTLDTASVIVDSSVADALMDFAVVDTSTPDASPRETDMYGTGCNEVVQRGSLVPITAGTGPKPAFTGGPVADGTWVLTRFADFAEEPAPQDVAITLVTAGGLWRSVAKTGPLVTRAEFAMSTSGSTLTSLGLCPAMASQTSSYTATPSELIFGSAAGQVTWYRKL